MTTISATTVLSSKHADTDKTLTTMLWRYPRWIHAEGRTHRLLDILDGFQILPPTPSIMECDDLSRNASSSRAIPVAKLIADIEADPAVPLFWGKNIGGMQANEELPDELAVKAYDIWMGAMEQAIVYARGMCALGIDDEGSVIGAHKQIVNRLLEPFSHITVVVTATEWTNFLHLRDHKDAEPHIACLASAVRAELNTTALQILKPGEWHLPFTRAHDRENFGLETLQKLSVARCASTSYKTVDGFDMTVDRAVSLFDKLKNAEVVHASPFEHQGQADTWVAGEEGPYGEWKVEHWFNKHQHGNFKGFRQFRKMIPNEAA